MELLTGFPTNSLVQNGCEARGQGEHGATGCTWTRVLASAAWRALKGASQAVCGPRGRSVVSDGSLPGVGSCCSASMWVRRGKVVHRARTMCTRVGAISVRSEVGHSAHAGAISVKGEIGHSAQLREAGARRGLREKLTYASHHRCLCVQLTKLCQSDRQCAHVHLGWMPTHLQTRHAGFDTQESCFETSRKLQLLEDCTKCLRALCFG